jgi:hypothetical protein
MIARPDWKYVDDLVANLLAFNQRQEDRLAVDAVVRGVSPQHIVGHAIGSAVRHYLQTGVKEALVVLD